MAPEIAEPLRARLVADPLAALLGIRIEALEAGFVRASMPVTTHLLNAAGTAHGGATMALIDVVHAVVSNSHGTLAVAQDVHTEFVTAGALGDVLECEGREVHRSRRTALYRIDVRVRPGEGEPPGRLVATALARVFRMDRPWLDDEGTAR
ncbi:MAG: PaaI family thioesterase [Dermatophilaceae bacterium]